MRKVCGAGWLFLAMGMGCSGTTETSAFVGAFEAETVTTVIPDGGDEPPIFSLNGQFLPGNEWPSCSSESVVAQTDPCCFAAGTETVPSLSAGTLQGELDVRDSVGATAESGFSLVFNADAGGYHSESPIPAVGLEWFATTLSAKGDVVSAFSVSLDGVDPLETLPPEPVVTPDLGQLGTLLTSQDWAVPLTPSQLEILFHDRLILEVDGVGSIICQVTDEAALNPPLVVPAALLANFSGHSGTVSIYRDEYTGFIDAGALLVGFRSGVGIRTSPGVVSFTP